MEILYLEVVESTQTYLIEKIKSRDLSAPIAICAKNQKSGIGSRGNIWESSQNSLYLSFALKKIELPKDLPIQSISIYFGLILVEILRANSSKCYLKWPNDIYLEKGKIGGIITNIFGEHIVCGVGINRGIESEIYTNLDIEIDNKKIVSELLEKIEIQKSWKHIFRKFQVEFHKSRIHHFHHGDKRVDLRCAILNDDGSISIDGERYYNFR